MADSNPELNVMFDLKNDIIIDEDAFAERFEGGGAMEALEEDLRFKDSLGIWALPAFLVECNGRSLLIRGVVDVETLMQAVVSVAACRVGGNLVCEAL